MYPIPTIEILNQDIINSESHFVKIDIVFNNLKIKKLKNFISDVTDIYDKIMSINSTYFVSFIFRESNIEIINESINLPHFINFDNCNIKIYIGDHLSNDIKEININNSNFINCNFEDISILLGINSKGVENLNIDLYNQKIKMLQFQHFYIKENNHNKFIIRNCEINRIMFWKVKSNIDINLQNININFSNSQKQLSLKECSFNKRFIFIDSHFNTNFELSNVSFNDDTSFKGLKIKKLDLSTTFFNSDKSINFSELYIKDSKNLSRNTARKIKHLLEKDSNKIESNYFHAYEMMARKKELSKEEITKNNINDKLIFKFNEQVSNHGLNWNLPVFWMLFIGLYFSGLFYNANLTNDEVVVFFISFTISLIFLIILKFDDIGRYIISIIPAIGFYLFLIIKPVFPVDTIITFLSIINFERDNNIISLTESTISKIIMGYLIYHFIIAVRKDTRK